MEQPRKDIVEGDEARGAEALHKPTAGGVESRQGFRVVQHQICTVYYSRCLAKLCLAEGNRKSKNETVPP